MFTNSLIFDIQNNFDWQENVSLEELVNITSIPVNSYTDICKHKNALRKSFSRLEAPVEESVEAKGVIRYTEYIPEVTSFIDRKDEEATIVIDMELIFSIFIDNTEVIQKFIRELQSIPKDSTLNIIVNIDNNDFNYAIIESGMLIVNLIRQLKCKKIFNFSAEANLTHLMLAACCDDVFVGDIASVSIVKADNGSHIPKCLIDVYKYIVKQTYDYWKEKGLFTDDEITNLFSAESDHSIQLFSDEIKRRLNK